MTNSVLLIFFSQIFYLLLTANSLNFNSNKYSSNKKNVFLFLE